MIPKMANSPNPIPVSISSFFNPKQRKKVIVPIKIIGKEIIFSLGFFVVQESNQNGNENHIDCQAHYEQIKNPHRTTAE